MFSFQCICLWKIPTKAFLQSELLGLLPLAPLTKEGKRRKVVKHVVDRLCDSDDVNRELLSLTYGFASLVFESENEQKWLREVFAVLEDMLMESWAFKEVAQKAEERGMEKGMEKGARETFLSMVKARFPVLVGVAEQVVASAIQYGRLQELMVDVVSAANEEDARQRMLAVLAEEKEREL